MQIQLELSPGHPNSRARDEYFFICDSQPCRVLRLQQDVMDGGTLAMLLSGCGGGLCYLLLIFVLSYRVKEPKEAGKALEAIRAADKTVIGMEWRASEERPKYGESVGNRRFAARLKEGQISFTQQEFSEYAMPTRLLQDGGYIEVVERAEGEKPKTTFFVPVPDAGKRRAAASKLQAVQRGKTVRRHTRTPEQMEATLRWERKYGRKYEAPVQLVPALREPPMLRDSPTSSAVSFLGPLGGSPSPAPPFAPVDMGALSDRVKNLFAGGNTNNRQASSPQPAKVSV